MIPRAARNNNPGNLRIGQPWQGLMPKDQMTPDQRAETSFAVFKEPKWGFRALAILLKNYHTMYGRKTIFQIISRFAPKNENDTTAYIQSVCDQVGVGPDDQIDTTRRIINFHLCKAIAKHETGSWEPYWSDDALADGLDLAGL